MADDYAMVIEGLEALDDLADLPEEILRAARIAVNRTLDRTRTESSRIIRSQVNLPASYVSGKRFEVASRPRGGDLSGTITARGRATSLARFVESMPRKNARGIMVQVKPGQSKLVRRAFLIKLRAGNANLDTKFNTGFAIRLSPGQSLDRKKVQARAIFPNVYLLYGPSVAQVFDSVRDDVTPDALNILEQEFLRQLDL